MSKFRTIEDVWEYLNNIPMFQTSGAAAANFTLDSIREFCAKMGNPQNHYPSIHVAGTNGKGTTCYLLEQVYSEGGYTTGLFTSPHLIRYNERVRVGRKEISDEKLLEFFRKTEQLLDSHKLSYFEISTVLAFWYFSDMQVDLAIIETGLGGRLDSTNIIDPELAVITSIGLDHQAILGNTLSEIAREKAGIIKEGKPAVLGNIEGDPLRVIRQQAQKVQAPVYLSWELVPVFEEGTVTLKSKEISIPTRFKEAINKWNVAVVWNVTELLEKDFPLSNDTKVQAIKAFAGAPGRFEKVHEKYEWYFSGSHNEQSLESSLDTLEKIQPRSEWILVCSGLRDKLNASVLRQLQGFKKTYFVEQEGERAAKYEDVKDQIGAERLNEDRKEIILEELKTELVIFIGSFYFYPIVKRWTANVS